MPAITLSDAVVKKILAHEKRIRFCAVVNERGEIEAGGIRPGVEPLEPGHETAKIATRLSLLEAIDRASSPFLGRPNWAIIHREKLIQILFPLPEHKQLQITATLDYEISNVAELSRYVDELCVPG